MGQMRQTGNFYARMEWQRLLDYTPEWKIKKSSNMEFLKSLVPAVISGEGATEHGGALPRETGPRLLRMKRMGLLAMGQTIEEDLVDPVLEIDPEIGSSRPAHSTRTRFRGTDDRIVYWYSSSFFLLYLLISAKLAYCTSQYCIHTRVGELPIFWVSLCLTTNIWYHYGFLCGFSTLLICQRCLVCAALCSCYMQVTQHNLQIKSLFIFTWWVISSISWYRAGVVIDKLNVFVIIKTEC